MSKRVAIIYNPSARGGKALKKRKKVELCLKSQNIDYDMILTRSESHLVEVADKAIHRYPVIIGAGGDTTINIIAHSILQGQQGNALGIISMGSTNDLAREIGVTRLKQACNAIHSESYQEIDVGMITSGEKNKPYFFLAQASIGLGVEVNRYVSAWMKRHPYVSKFHTIAQTTSGVAGIYNSFKNKAVPISLQLDTTSITRSFDSCLLIFNNTSYFAGRFQPSPLASPVDGKLDCCIFHSSTFSQLLRTMMQVRSYKHLEQNRMEILQDHYFRIQSPRPFEFQIDGEIFSSEGSIEVSIMPRALKLVSNAIF